MAVSLLLMAAAVAFWTATALFCCSIDSLSSALPRSFFKMVFWSFCFLSSACLESLALFAACSACLLEWRSKLNLRLDSDSLSLALVSASSFAFTAFSSLANANVVLSLP